MYKKILPIVFVIVTTVVTLATTLHQQSTSNINTAGATPEAAVTVKMTNTLKFTPDTVRIEPGQTVKWNNSSLLAHSVTADPAQSTIEGSAKLPDGAETFDSGMMDPEQTFTHTFEVPGTYQYFCIPHEGAKMYGWVIVKQNH